MNEWLVKMRDKKYLTQEEVAKIAGMPRTTYCSIEQGRRNPSVKSAKKIAEALEFPWAIFFDDELRESTLKVAVD